MRWPSPRLTLFGWTTFAVAAVSFIVIAPLLLDTDTPWGQHGEKASVLVVVAYAGVHLAQLLAVGRDRIVSLFFWLFVYVFLGLAPLAQLNARRFTLPGVYTADEVVLSSAIVMAGLIAYDVGRLSRRAAPLDRSRLVRRLADAELDVRRLRTLAAAGFAASVIAIATLPDPGALFQSRNAFDAATSSDVAVKALQTATLSVPSFLALYFVIGGRRALPGSPRLVPAPLVVALVLVNLAVNNPISQSRFWFGTVSVSLLMLVLPVNRPNVFRMLGVAALLFAVAVFPYSDAFRATDRQSIEARTITTQLSEKGDYDSFQQVLNGVRLERDDGFTFGRRALSTVLFWVPRGLWEGKSRDSGVDIGERAGYGFTNLSSPLWIEGYLDLGFAGVGAVFFVFGRVSETLEQAWLARRRFVTSAVALAVPPLAVYQVILLRGSLLQATGRLAAMALLMGYCHRRRSRSAAVVPQASTPRASSTAPASVAGP